MIVIAIGSNLPGSAGTPLQTCEAALVAFAAHEVRVRRRSSWYRSPPWAPPMPGAPPAPEQPWYVNGVAIVETRLDPAALLAMLHGIEAEFGRVRAAGTMNAARPLDLDIIDYDALVRSAPPPILPHPRLSGRAFVLRPLAEIAPEWRHPESGRSVKDLLAALPADAVAEPLPAGADSQKTH